MLRLLIAENSELFSRILHKRLQADMQVKICHDGCTAIDLLHSFKPHVMILNLHLPIKDGFTVLRQSAYIPPVILGITSYQSGHILRTAYSLGISQVVLMPTANSLTANLLSLLEQDRDPSRKPDLRKQARTHLQNLNFLPHLDGYKQLTVALPLYAADPKQPLFKELYPTVADILGINDVRQVEHSIRVAIGNAWAVRDTQVWEKYFPEALGCPNNKRFLSRMAELMYWE